MDRLRKKRNPLRAAIEGAVLDAEAELANDVVDYDQLEFLVEKLDRVSLDIVDVDQEIMTALLEADATEVDINTEGAEIEAVKNRVHATRFKLNRRIQPTRTASPTPSTVSTSGGAAQRSYRLPKIEIAKYSGELLVWLGWWSQYKKIHNDSSLDNSEKFQYLIQSIKSGSRAKDLVDSYPQSDENYPKVIEALQSRFGRKKLLKQVYVRELLKMVIHNVKNDRQLELSKLHDKLESHLRALESLGVTWEQSAEFLFPMVESSLPDDILVAWQRSSLYGQDGTQQQPPKSELDYLMTFIQQEVESEEQRKLARAGLDSDKSKVQKSSNQMLKPRRHSTGDSNSDLSTASALFSSNSNQCIFCSRPHASHDCIKAQTMTLEERRTKLKEVRGCFICLRTGHNANKCKAAVRCLVCGKKHSALLCPEVGTKAPEMKSTCDREQNVKIQSGLASSTCNQDVLLESLVVKLVNGKDEVSVRLLFDNGSQRSSVLKTVASELKFKVIGQETIRRNLFGGTITAAKVQDKFELQLQGTNKRIHKIVALGEEIICGEIPRIPPGPWMAELRQHKIWVTDTQFNGSESQVVILIGSDYYQTFMTGKRLQLDCGLVAVETVFGWTLCGPVHYTRDVNLATTITSMLSTELSVPDLWNLDILGIKDPAEHQTKEQKDLDTRAHFQKTVLRSQDGRYEVQLPWVSECQEIPDNRAVAEKRLQSTVRKLESQNMISSYDQVFKSWAAEGIIEEVGNAENSGPSHYIPHRAIIKDSATTPIRPVFDASCKTGRSPSLNDLLLKGPNLLELIPDLLLRFRQRRLGVISDVRKAFLMVGVSEQDRNYLRFFWQDPQTKQIKVFRHCRVVFGVTCSPFLLAAVIEHHIKNLDESRKEVGDKLLKSLYVDNCVVSVNNLEEYQDFKTAATEILAEAKMELRQWEVSGESEVSKVLGVIWNKTTDTLSCEVGTSSLPEKITKRTVLSQVQKIFDPLGFLSPVLLQVKLILQESWKEKLGWDEALPVNLAEQYITWTKSVDQLSKIQVPRYMSSLNAERLELHTFTDASKHAYAAVVFLRTVCGSDSTIKILQSKTRVSPLKIVSIPRLELLGCTVGARLTNSTKKALELMDIPTTYWSDSSTALSWIKRNSEWGTFVGNRVREICNQSDVNSWRFVPGTMNPADLPSRGCSPVKLLESRWWEGPSWLKKESEWPTQTYDVNEDAVNQERKVTSTKLLNLSESSWFKPPFSSYSSNVRVIGWIIRFIAKRFKKSTEAGELTAAEVQKAEAVLLNVIQRESFDLNATVINGIRVVRGEDGLVRVNSKLLHRQDSVGFRQPVLLPNSHQLVRQLIQEEHRRNKHAGTQFIMSKLRERIWILKSRQTIKKEIGTCVICKRFSVKSVNVPSATLPENRVKEAKAFQVTGVDLAGPLYLKDKTKAWIVLFTCAVYRCIHLELVTSLNTDSFLLALFRFISRRGRVSTIYSDNGTNFVGAENLFKELDWTRIQKETRTQRIQWIFNPPSAPWWGGWWERLVQTVKGLLRRTLGHSKLNYVHLETCLCEVEAIVNGRPLTYVTEDQDDLVPLTPAMFLQDIQEASYPEAEVLDALGFQEKYHRLQEVRQQLRGRFRKEYLGLLIQRGESKKIHEFKNGDVVLIGSENKKRLDWPMGRISQLMPGRDGETRTARIKTFHGELVRPLQRLYPLEVPAESFPVPEQVKSAAKKEKERKKQNAEQSSLEASASTAEVVSRFGRISKKPVRFMS